MAYLCTYLFKFYDLIESILTKPKAISTFMTLEEFIGGQGQRSKPFYGSGEARKGI